MMRFKFWNEYQLMETLFHLADETNQIQASSAEVRVAGFSTSQEFTPGTFFFPICCSIWQW